MLTLIFIELLRAENLELSVCSCLANNVFALYFDLREIDWLPVWAHELYEFWFFSQ